MEEHGQFDPNIRKQAEEFDNSIAGSHEKVFGTGQEQSNDAVQRMWEQARAFDPNVGTVRRVGEEVADHRKQAARDLYEKAIQLDPDKVAELEAVNRPSQEEAA
jgi:hypothetical protein